jgi:hypothetical protein
LEISHTQDDCRPRETVIEGQSCYGTITQPATVETIGEPIQLLAEGHAAPVRAGSVEHTRSATPDARQAAPWQRLNFRPLPHGHGLLRPDDAPAFWSSASLRFMCALTPAGARLYRNSFAMKRIGSSM